MMKLRQSRAPIVTIVSIVIAAWLFASNHCALAALASATQQASAHDCCHSENGKTPERSLQCCDALNAPSPTPTIAPVVQFTELMPAWSPLPLYVLAPPEALPTDTVVVPVAEATTWSTRMSTIWEPAGSVPKRVSTLPTTAPVRSPVS